MKILLYLKKINGYVVKGIDLIVELSVYQTINKLYLPKTLSVFNTPSGGNLNIFAFKKINDLKIENWRFEWSLPESTKFRIFLDCEVKKLYYLFIWILIILWYLKI